MLSPDTEALVDRILGNVGEYPIASFGDGTPPLSAPIKTKGDLRRFLIFYEERRAQMVRLTPTRCETCAHWTRDPSGKIGWCDTLATGGKHPITEEGSWCMDWRERDA